VVNLFWHLTHSRRRRVARPSRASRDSNTFDSSNPQYGHNIFTL